MTIIYSGDLKDSRNDVITSVEDYREICSLTGGLFIPADKVTFVRQTFKLLISSFLSLSKADTDEIVGILSKSVETAKATLVIQTGLSGRVNVTFPVDNFWQVGQ